MTAFLGCLEYEHRIVCFSIVDGEIEWARPLGDEPIEVTAALRDAINAELEREAKRG